MSIQKREGCKNAHVSKLDYSFTCSRLKSIAPFTFFKMHIPSMIWVLFSSPQNPKTFQDSPSHRILRHVHEALNIDENKNLSVNRGINLLSLVTS